MSKCCAGFVLILVVLLCLAGPLSAEEVTITGKVLGPNGQPVADAQVLVQYRAPGKFATGRIVTDPQGAFSQTCDVKDPTGLVHVAARKPGFAMAWDALSATEQITLELGADPVACTGTVQDHEGKAIAGATVRVSYLKRPVSGKLSEARGPTRTDLEALRRPSFYFRDHAYLGTVTDVAGKFEIAGLPGDQQMHLVAVADRRAHWVTEDYVATSTQDIEIILPPEATISGQVTHNGEPVAGVRVYCYDYGRGGAPTISDVTAEDGRYRLSNLRATVHSVLVTPPEGLTCPGSGPIELSADQHREDVDLVLSPGGLVRGKVVEANTGLPVAGFRVHARGSNRSTSVKTDDNGNYMFRLPAASFEISCPIFPFGSSGYGSAEPRKRIMEVVEGETVTGVDFVLKPQPSLDLRGQVLGPDGEPLAGVRVGVTGSYYAPSFLGYFQAESDAQGNFELQLKRIDQDNEWCVVACDPERGLAGYTLMEAAQQVPEDSVTVEVGPGGYLVGTIVDTEDNPVPDVPTSISLWPHQRGYGQSMSGAPTDEEGKVRIGPLPAGLQVTLSPGGKFRNLISKFSREKAVIPARGECELAPIVLNLQGRTMTGWVGDAEQNPVEEALVFVSGLDESFRSDAEGNFELTSLPALGKLWVVAMHPTEPLFAAEQLDPDWGFRASLILRPSVSATGRIINENGEPIKGARLRGYPQFPISWSEQGGGAMFVFHSWEEDLRRRLGQRDHILRPVTDADGKWQADGLIAGAQYVFWIELPDGSEARERYEFIAQPDPVTDAGEIVLEE